MTSIPSSGTDDSAINKSVRTNKSKDHADGPATDLLIPLFRSLPLAIIQLDPQGYVQAWNPAAERIFGWQEIEVVGQPHPIIPPELKNHFSGLQKRVLSGESFSRIESQRLHRSGKNIEVCISAAPVLGNGGNITGTVIMVEDISERKSAEFVLKQYNQRLSILRQIDQGIMLHHTPQAIAAYALKKIRQIINCDWISILLFEQGVQEATVFAIVGKKNESRTYKSIRINNNERMDLLKMGKILISDDLTAQENPLTPFVETLIKKELKSSMSAPLFADGKLTGMLSFLSGEIGFFTGEHAEIAMEEANQLAVAIMQAQLAEKIEMQRRDLELRVKERTSELESKNEQLERLNKLFVGREFRIKELREKVKELEKILKKKNK